MKRLGILISGRGSNMTALMAGIESGAIDAETALVISNRDDAPGLARAHARGVKTQVISQRRFKKEGRREKHEREIAAALDAADVDIVCLAGYMRILSPWIVERYAGRLLNIHPSLLPAFPGQDAQRQALESGVRVTGCTVHFVDAAVDHGPIVVQAAVPVLESDDEASLSARILAQEHRVYPLALQLLCADRVRLEAGRVRFLGVAEPNRETALVSPSPGEVSFG